MHIKWKHNLIKCQQPPRRMAQQTKETCKTRSPQHIPADRDSEEYAGEHRGKRHSSIIGSNNQTKTEEVQRHRHKTQHTQAQIPWPTDDSPRLRRPSILLYSHGASPVTLQWNVFSANTCNRQCFPMLFISLYCYVNINILLWNTSTKINT